LVKQTVDATQEDREDTAAAANAIVDGVRDLRAWTLKVVTTLPVSSDNSFSVSLMISSVEIS
jgi:hypothetical protein